ncbi:hypothetical protein EDC36_10586 [Tepidimonas ignava]|uniref:Cytochrome c domain-containing protein n=1 Tax=Tepidimonas ignava TaxID=114249 RepID=A0A4R3LFP2_9BURK|nr:hypothetical protein [Tepidimonas ignava]TCS98330.1 hypothetical protein EDC36_10586 [Tepidimonas ignava]TSE21839.1 hypothetical protein Tigna_01566 [Tepidimonas ignava]
MRTMAVIPCAAVRMRLTLLPWVLVLTSAGLPGGVRADAAMAVDKGCLNCHGDPPRGKAPTLATLAQRYAPLSADELARKAERLCEHRLLGGIAAHEKLTPEESLQLVRWIAAGAR